MKRAAAYSRKVVDPANSVSWFAMDGLWLAQLEWPAYLATGLTLTTGGLLLLLNRRRGPKLNDDLALNAWMWTNALWLMSDLGENPALRFAAMGVGCLGAFLLVRAVKPWKERGRGLRRLSKMRVESR